MGNGVAKLTPSCCSCGFGRRHVSAAVTSEPLDNKLKGFGHSFCYLNPAGSLPDESAAAAAFRSISGAAVSANAATPPSTAADAATTADAAAVWPAFESSASFSSAPLHAAPRILPSGAERYCFLSGPMPAGYQLSGPIDTSFLSGPLDDVRKKQQPLLRRKISSSLLMAFSGRSTGEYSAADTSTESSFPTTTTAATITDSSYCDVATADGRRSSGVEWAQGRAGEDRMHVVVSEEHGWLFIGIYDGFNGPDATDYLLSHLYPAVQTQLRGLLWEAGAGERRQLSDDPVAEPSPIKRRLRHRRPAAARWEESKRSWKSEWDRGRLELERRLKDQLRRPSEDGPVNHQEVLKAMSRALRRTEEAYFRAADEAADENPELALMGSCVLVMLMKGEDVYLMNVGDSRAVLAHRQEEHDLWGSNQDLERIKEETPTELEGHHEAGDLAGLASQQLTVDHSTSDEEETRRIWIEHPDDASTIANDRVKGSLKVTRAFGAGFLKKPKWNEALLEMFRVDYIGASPYITCNPSLYHHRLAPEDRFLILSSDGLYQYFTNEEAVAQAEAFITSSPEGDPAQHLVEEALLRAADKAGMDFNELLEIPQGERRRYHDDISVIVVSLEGRIWRSCM